MRESKVAFRLEAKGDLYITLTPQSHVGFMEKANKKAIRGVIRQ